MGLLVTELTELGVVMVGDGPRVFQVPGAAVAVGYWGMDQLAGNSTSQRLAEFVERAGAGQTVGGVARALADETNGLLGPIPDGRCNLGFHVVGYEDAGDGPLPSFYHVHAGVSQALAMRGESVDGTRFNANHDLPPTLVRERTAGGRVYLTHNGDFLIYAFFLRALGEWFGQLRQRGISVPITADLSSRADFLAFQFSTVARACKFTSLGPVIRDEVHTVALPPPGTGVSG
jgi:hypothetical protein